MKKYEDNEPRLSEMNFDSPMKTIVEKIEEESNLEKYNEDLKKSFAEGQISLAPKPMNKLDVNDGDQIHLSEISLTEIDPDFLELMGCVDEKVSNWQMCCKSDIAMVYKKKVRLIPDE